MLVRHDLLLSRKDVIVKSLDPDIQVFSDIRSPHCRVC